MAARKKPAKETAAALGAVSITFVRDYEVQAAEGATFKAGDAVECGQASADHFIRRGAAVLTEHYPVSDNANDSTTDARDDPTV